MIDVSTSFHLATVDHSELLNVLLNHFGGADLPSSTRHVFLREGLKGYLEVSRRKDGAIRNIHITPDFLRSELTLVESEVSRCLLENQTPSAVQIITFSKNKPVEGHFQYRHEFQLSPVPDEAPRPPQIFGPNPFLLKFEYIGSVEPFICHRRVSKLGIMLIHQLNVLLNTHLSSRYTCEGFAWVVELPEMVNPRGWRQLGYGLASSCQPAHPLAMPPNATPLRRQPHEQYYKLMWFESQYLLQVPDSLETSLDCIRGLGKLKRARFDLASAWLFQSQSIRDESISASYVALATAIEALLEPSRSREAAHNSDGTDSISKRFQEFMNNHVPNAKQHATALKQLYHVRSMLVHGGGMFTQDLKPWNQFMNPQSDWEKIHFVECCYLVKQAILHWLWSNSRQREDIEI